MAWARLADTSSKLSQGSSRRPLLRSTCARARDRDMHVPSTRDARHTRSDGLTSVVVPGPARYASHASTPLSGRSRTCPSVHGRTALRRPFRPERRVGWKSVATERRDGLHALADTRPIPLCHDLKLSMPTYVLLCRTMVVMHAVVLLVLEVSMPQLRAELGHQGVQLVRTNGEHVS